MTTLNDLNGYLDDEAYTVRVGELRALLSASIADTAKPVAWVRYRSDGGFEGPIMDTDTRMCDTRRSFWTPLYASPAIDAASATLAHHQPSYEEGYKEGYDDAETIAKHTNTLTTQDIEEIAAYVESECKACPGMTTLYIAAETAVLETLHRLSLPPPIEVPENIIADTAGAKQQLSNLLARIHRDGGHYEAEHGTGKAVDDADLIVAKLNAAADAAQKPIAWINADANYCTKDAIAAQHVEGLIPVFAAPPAPSVADTTVAFDVAHKALDDYQANWDTGLPGEYAQQERIHMECAVEAVREALNEAMAVPERECNNSECGWHGKESETVQMKHGHPNKLCPNCHETTEQTAPSVADAAGASDVPQDPRHAAWLDFLMSRQLVITHTKDCEYWGVAQVFEDEGEYKLRTVVKPLHDTRVEAVIAAFEKESGND